MTRFQANIADAINVGKMSYYLFLLADDFDKQDQRYRNLKAISEELDSLPHRIEMAWVVGRGNKEQFVKALRGEDD